MITLYLTEEDAQKKIERFVQYKKDYLKLAYFNALPYDTFVEPFIDMWRKMFPDSIVNIIAAEAGVDKELIMNDSVDLLVANVLDFNEWDGAEVIPLMSKEMKIIVSENHPWYNKEIVSEEDIAEASMQVYGNRPIFEEKAFLPEIRPKERIVMYNSSSYMANLIQGYAFGVVSDVHIFWEGNFRLIDFPGDKRYYSYFSLVFKQFHPLAGKIRKVGKILQDQLESQI